MQKNRRDTGAIHSVKVLIHLAVAETATTSNSTSTRSVRPLCVYVCVWGSTWLGLYTVMLFTICLFPWNKLISLDVFISNSQLACCLQVVFQTKLLV